MASDIIRQIFSTRTLHNGYAVVGTARTTTANSSGITLRPRNHYPIEISGVSNKEDTRWDDKTYYST